MGYLETSANLLSSARFEGTYDFMYLDTVGYVTVGVGEMIPDVNAAKKYPFLLPSGANASGEEIETDYNRVDDMDAGLWPPKKYWVKDALRLPEGCIQDLLMNRLKVFDGDLRSHFRKYDTFPDAVKLALLDMIYNLGKTKLFGKFKTFDRAVKAENWEQAAKHCHRIGPNADRNAWTATQFRSSAVKKPVPRLPVHPAHHDGPTMLAQNPSTAIS